MPLASLSTKVTGCASASRTELAPSNPKPAINFFISLLLCGNTSWTMDLFRVHFRAPWQTFILPAVDQAKASLAAILDTGALKTIDHITGIGEAVIPQELCTGLATLIAGSAHGDDLGVG